MRYNYEMTQDKSSLWVWKKGTILGDSKEANRYYEDKLQFRQRDLVWICYKSYQNPESTIEAEL